MTEIIGLMGASGAGKSEVATYLVEHHGYTRMRFADGLKDMLKTLGLTEAQIDGDEKHLPIPLLGGKTYRDAATSLGTGWGRDMMDEDLWVRALEQKLLAHLLQTKSTKIVIDDVRYPNELALVKRYMGTTITVRRPEVEPHWNWLQTFLIKRGLTRFSGIHSSETLYRLVQTDFVLWNQDDIFRLRQHIDRLMPAIVVPRKELAHAA